MCSIGGEMFIVSLLCFGKAFFSIYSSDSEGTFETPEAESPSVTNLLGQLDNSKHTGEMTKLLGKFSVLILLKLFTCLFMFSHHF